MSKTSDWLTLKSFIKVYHVYKYNGRNSVKGSVISKRVNSNPYFKR